MSWIGFNTATTGMFTSQRKLYTVSHNVSNADREGYSRQKVKSSSTIPLHISGQGYIGTGIGIDSIDRVRDVYLDKKFRTETASFGNWDMKNDALGEIEGVLRGSSEEGINVNMDELFAAIEDLSTNPSEMAYRTAFKEKTETLTKTMNETVKRLYKQQKDLNFEVKTKVKQVNDYAEQISSLNSEIFALEIDGSSANDLRDQRDLIVDKLSKLVDIQAEERVINVEETKSGQAIEIKKYEVRIGGISLVDHDMTSKLKDPPSRMPNTINPEEPLYKVEWASGGDLKLKGGELKGLLDVRDGGYETIDETVGTDPQVNAKYINNASNGIPYYIKRLDEFAQTLFAKMNEIHFQGTNLNGEDEKLLFSIEGKNTEDADSGFKDMVTTLKDLNAVIATAPNPKATAYEPEGENHPDYKTAYDTYKVTYDEAYKKYSDAVKSEVRADNISISGDIIDDLNNIATIDSTDKNNIENNDILKEMLKAREDTSFFGKDEKYQGKPEDYLTSILSTLGTDNQQAQRMTKVQDLIVKGAVNQKLSVSGVNLDEEMADMVKFQQIFTASAKMVSTFDQMFDTIVNRLGMVGR